MLFVFRIEHDELVSVAVVRDGIVDAQDDEVMNVRGAREFLPLVPVPCGFYNHDVLPAADTTGTTA